MFLKLISKEGEMFKINYDILKFSKFLKLVINYQDNVENTSLIFLNNIESKVLIKIIEYCKYKNSFLVLKKNSKNQKFNKNNCENSEWVSQFLSINKYLIIKIMLAAAFLEIKCLLKILCRYVAEELSSKDFENLATYFINLKVY